MVDGTCVSGQQVNGVDYAQLARARVRVRCKCNVTVHVHVHVHAQVDNKMRGCHMHSWGAGKQ